MASKSTRSGTSLKTELERIWKSRLVASSAGKARWATHAGKVVLRKNEKAKHR
jgi:hypothetical protein